MIQLQHSDEYGVVYAVDTYLTVADAQEALNQMECALDDCTNSSQAYRLQSAIDQLKEAIAEQQEQE